MNQTRNRRRAEVTNIERAEQDERVVITEEQGAPSDDGRSRSEFARRHPVIAYLFGDMVRGFYLVGCLSLDLLTPVQVRAWFPGQDVLVLPPAIAGIVLLVYGELRLYRRLWPRPKIQRVVRILSRQG